MKDMDWFVGQLSTTDTKQKLGIGQELLTYLQDDGSIECADIGLVIDALAVWIHSSNFKVSLMGLDLMIELIKRMESYFKPFIPSVLPVVIDRLGDSKELVRERCQLLIISLMEHGAITPQNMFDRLLPAFSHKNNNVRDEVLKCLTATLNLHGAGCLAVSKLVPAIVKLLSDPNLVVRDTAMNTLADVYRHVGERLRQDLIKKHSLPPTKLPALMTKFDEIKAAGDFLPTAHSPNNLLDEDELDRAAPPSGAKVRSNSVGPKRGILASSKTLPQTPSQAGAVDEEGFLRAFEDVPTVQIFSHKDLEENLTKIRQVISDPNQDWSKRVESIKKIRSLLISGAKDYDEFYSHLRLLDPPFQTCAKDLRSQVVREACVTVAFLSQCLGNKFEHFAESLLPVLINLIQNSAKVVASAGQVAIGFVVRHTHSFRLIPHICNSLSSKSREIRRAGVKFLHQILSSWSTHTISRHLVLIQNALQSSIADADQEVRMTARKVYWAFKDQFPDQAEALLNSLDAPYKRSLHSDMSNSSSSNSLNQSHKSKPPAKTTPTHSLLRQSLY